MSSFTQERRSLSVDSPLGTDVLLLLGFSGTEAISQPFRYQLDLASEHEGISPKDIVGEGLTWSVRRVDTEPRFFHGAVSRFSAGPRGDRGLWSYRVEVVPWLWFLTRTSDCRIFQDKSTPEIVEAVFQGFGFRDFEFALKGKYAKREYCVQYRETAFNFVSRLLEAEGIFYSFRHEKGKHTLVLADRKSAYGDCPEGKVKFSRGSLAHNHVTAWEHQYEFRTGKWAQTDYNFATPSTSLLTTMSTVIDQPGMDRYEEFDYPGEYYVKGDGEPITKVRMEEEEAGYETVQGASTCCTFTPGGRFTLENHDVDSECGDYVITSIQHSATEASYDASAGGLDYSNSFTCIRASVTFRPPRVTPKSQVKGPQTAVVTGPGGEEIYVDQYGRVKVQFFWDRQGKKDENSSCWIRVAEQWAGKNWGFVAHPRMGQEVVVDFLEGDPDRPLITGRVYNAEQMPPYGLPGSKTQTGIKTRSTLGGTPANFNEIRFEDKKGSEQVYIHAEKNQDIVVENDETHSVGHDRTKTIGNDETTHVKHDRTETVDNDETITIHRNRTETVDVNETIAVGGDRVRTVDGNESVTVVMMRNHTVGINEAITVGGAREVTVGGFQSITVGGYQAFIVGANQSLQVGKNLTENIGGDRGETVVGKRTDNIGKDLQSSIGGSLIVSVKKDELLNVGKNFQIEAGEKIVLQTGDASITLKKDGTILIKGKNISIRGSGKIDVKADGDIAMKGSKITEN